MIGIPDVELFASGHRACAGCGAALAMRHLLKAAGPNTIVAHATGCMEVVSTPYPQTSWRVPWIHVAFENAAAVASGIDAALKAAGKRDGVNVIALAGDGGTYDIGLQALSGAVERGHKFTYVCYLNEAYANTGAQRSGDTPKYAATTTTPIGSKIRGKMQPRKPLPLIMGAHGAYVATANIAYPEDFIEKVRKALSVDGPSYVEVFTACIPSWRIPPSASIEVCKKAFQSKAIPLFEIENGIVKNLKEPSSIIPVKEYLMMQGRFKHLTEVEVEELQQYYDRQWDMIKRLQDSGVRIA